MFRKSALLVGLAAGLATAVSQGQDFSHWGYLRLRTDQGTPACAVVTAGEGSRVVKNVTIRYLGGEEHVSFRMYKDTWRIPPGTTIPVTFDFMDGKPLTLDAFGQDKIVNVDIPKEATAIFLLTMTDNPKMRISFPIGKEPAWVIHTRNMKQPMTKFVKCMQGISRTQPF